MELSEFDYDLPKELIAQEPTEERDASRLLVLDRAKEGVSHHAFPDILSLLAQFLPVVLSWCFLQGDLIFEV